MTEFEKNAKYSYCETLNYLESNGWKYPHLRTFSYRGIDVITYGNSDKTRGFVAKFFKNGKLLKMRRKVFKKDIDKYCITYIDLVLKQKENGKV